LFSAKPDVRGSGDAAHKAHSVRLLGDTDMRKKEGRKRMALIEFNPSSTAQLEAGAPTPRPINLKARLVFADGVALSGGFALSAFLLGATSQAQRWEHLFFILFATMVGLVVLRCQGLFLARVSAVRAVELTRVTYSSGILALCLGVTDRLVHRPINQRWLALGTVLSWLLLVVGRSAFRAYVRTKRATGKHLRKLLLVGADSEIARLVELFGTHKELGLDVVGLVGDPDDASRNGLQDLWLGDVGTIDVAVAAFGANGVVVSPSSFTAPRLTTLIQHLQDEHVHVHIATGITGISAGRLRSLPMSYEPMLYVEAAKLSKVQVTLKRAFDIFLSLVVLVVAAPAWLAVAIGIKLGDRGPIFFRQTRVGKDGTTFRLLKFRTMRVDAEQLLGSMLSENERHGPLFKIDKDPRVTTIGRFLRETSLDELPQLINVLRGQMSLVGPRPALPSEVATFGSDLRQRELVLPGITGLWQVEARDNPSFEAYRRLDLFYVENWSVVLDLMILMGTVEQLAAKIVMMAVRKVRRRPEHQEAHVVSRV
jgi:exopolysaccharide biosynthesis polyprenyl glycosylphosphotransferase